MTTTSSELDGDDGGPPASSWWGMIEHGAMATPDAVMLVDEHNRRLTFSQYLDVAELVAAGLAARGVSSGSCVSWQLPTGIEAAVLMGALGRLGAVQNPIIPALREHEVDMIVQECAPTLIVVPTIWRGFDFQSMATAIARRHGSSVLTCDVRATDHVDVALPMGDRSRLPAVEPHDPGTRDLPVRWVFYSSGTTSRPKGVRHTDRAVLAAGAGLCRGTGLRRTDVHPLAFPIAHIGGPSLLCAHLTVGACAVLIEAFDPQSTPTVIARHRPTILGSGVPFFNSFLAAQERHGQQPLFPDLRLGVSGGAPTPPELHFAVRDKLGGRGIASMYGMTEFPVATATAADDSDEVMAHTVGRANPGVEIRVVGPDGRHMAPGLEGEILLRGPQCFVGYVDASLDLAAFLPHSGSDSDPDGFLRTGDLGTLDEGGLLRITGRIKDVIIRNGENISAPEVERALLQHPTVADAAVIGVPDPRTGERAVAFIVLAGREQPTLEGIAAACRSMGLAAYKIPEQIEVIDQLPRNSLGKTLKTELRARVAPVSP